MSPTPFPNVRRCTYRGQPEDDFLQIPQTGDLLLPHTVRDAVDELVEGFECRLFSDGNDDVSLDLLASVFAQCMLYFGLSIGTGQGVSVDSRAHSGNGGRDCVGSSTQFVLCSHISLCYYD